MWFLVPIDFFFWLQIIIHQCNHSVLWTYHLWEATEWQISIQVTYNSSHNLQGENSSRSSMQYRDIRRYGFWPCNFSVIFALASLAGHQVTNECSLRCNNSNQHHSRCLSPDNLLHAYRRCGRWEFGQAVILKWLGAVIHLENRCKWSNKNDWSLVLHWVLCYNGNVFWSLRTHQVAKYHIKIMNIQPLVLILRHFSNPSALLTPLLHWSPLCPSLTLLFLGLFRGYVDGLCFFSFLW